jgi:hypothetical protein
MRPHSQSVVSDFFLQASSFYNEWMESTEFRKNLLEFIFKNLSKTILFAAIVIESTTSSKRK